MRVVLFTLVLFLIVNSINLSGVVGALFLHRSPDPVFGYYLIGTLVAYVPILWSIWIVISAIMNARVSSRSA